jgi:hypothetical protein
MAESKQNTNGQDPQEETIALVDEKGVAKSPFSKYPGEIRFPERFNGGTYKTITRALVKTEEDWNEDLFDLLPYWRVAKAIVEFDVEGIDPDADFDEQPGEILRWVRDASIEYSDRFLTPARSLLRRGKALEGTT